MAPGSVYPIFTGKRGITFWYGNACTPHQGIVVHGTLLSITLSLAAMPAWNEYDSDMVIIDGYHPTITAELWQEACARTPKFPPLRCRRRRQRLLEARRAAESAQVDQPQKVHVPTSNYSEAGCETTNTELGNHGVSGQNNGEIKDDGAVFETNNLYIESSAARGPGNEVDYNDIESSEQPCCDVTCHMSGNTSHNKNTSSIAADMKSEINHNSHNQDFDHITSVGGTKKRQELIVISSFPSPVGKNQSVSHVTSVRKAKHEDFSDRVSATEISALVDDTRTASKKNSPKKRSRPQKKTPRKKRKLPCGGELTLVTSYVLSVALDDVKWKNYRDNFHDLRIIGSE